MGGVHAEGQNERGACFGVRFLIEKEKDRWRVLDGFAKAEPGVERDITYDFRRNIAQIENDQAKTAALQKQVRGAQRLIGIAASHPKEIFEIYSSGFGGVRIEGVASVDERAGFGLGCARDENGKQNAGAAGTGRAANFRQAAAGQAARERIDFGDAGGDGLKNFAVAVSEGGGDTCCESGFDGNAECGASGHFRFFFALEILRQRVRSCQV